MELSRRNFVESAGIAGAAALVGIAGGSAIGIDTAAASEATASADADLANATDAEVLEWLKNDPEVTEDLVLDDGTVVPVAYVRMRNRINRTGEGVGTGDTDPSTWQFFLDSFTPEQAEAYLAFPTLEWFQVGDLPQDRTEEEWLEICEDMASRGLIYRVRRAGIPHFHTLTFVHGLFEFGMKRYEEEGFLGELFGMTTADNSLWNSDTPVYHPIPVAAEIVGDSKVLPYDDWKAIVARNTSIAVAPCQCRWSRQLLGTYNPDDTHPMETCLAFGECAEYYIENGIGRQIDQEEATQIIQRSIDAGMVIESEYTKQSEVICSCHSDCCYLLGTVRAADGDLPAMAHISNYELRHDEEACIQCGACVERCPMRAITMDEKTGYPVVDNACVRCGQCGLVCPVNARMLFELPEEARKPLAEDMQGDYVAKAIERARKGLIVDFVG